MLFMNQTQEKRTSITRFTGLIACLMTLIVGATMAQTPSRSPDNPAFKAYLKAKAEGTVKSLSDDWKPLGYVPPPSIHANMLKRKLPVLQAEYVLPTSYDMRTTGKLTSVKDQGNCGSCWAFGTFGSLESSLMPGENLDFSENNLKNLAGFDNGPCDGGNAYMSEAYLARWDGPVSEADDPYGEYDYSSPTGLTVRKHLQEAYWLPDDNNWIKNAIYAYGAMYGSFYWQSTYYNSSTYGYYYSGTSSSNHAITVVGWDDNYSRYNFKNTPPGDGAYIIKNSWASDWGQNGYFYISYYDAQFGDENVIFRTPQATSVYDNIYQYDPYGWVYDFGYDTTFGWGANVFTAKGAEKLKAVSFIANDNYCDYEIRIYKDPTNGPINASGPVLTQTGSKTYMGYYTISLNTAIDLTKGQKYSVVVKFNTPYYGYPIPLEAQASGYSPNASSNAKESYISYDGSSFDDMTTYNSMVPKANICIKAFTIDNNKQAAFTVGKASGPAFHTANFVNCSQGNFSSFNWSFGDGGTATTQNATHVYHTVGIYTVRLITSDGYSTQTVTKPDYITVTTPLVPAVKLAAGETLNPAYNLSPYLPGESGSQYAIATNFMALATLNGETINQAAYSSATIGSNNLQISYSGNTANGLGLVKYSSYRLAKLPRIGLNPGDSVNVSLAGYCRDSAGTIIPPSFGYKDALVVEDTTLLTAEWLDSSTIKLTALSKLTGGISTKAYVIASNATTAPFGFDQDREAIAVYSNYLPIGNFQSLAQATSDFAMQIPDDMNQKAPTPAFLPILTDMAGDTATNVVLFPFNNSSQGMKITPSLSKISTYNKGSWYTARIRLFSPDTGNTMQALLYNYKGIVPDDSHVDITANIYFGIPTTWTWIEMPLYANKTGKGYPQIVLKAGSQSSTRIYVDQVQVLANDENFISSPRADYRLGYGYSSFDNAAVLAMGWSTTESYTTSMTKKPALSFSGMGQMLMNFSGTTTTDAGMMGMKLTAKNNTSGVYTPAVNVGSQVGVLANVSKGYGGFTTYNSIVLLACYGVQSSGAYDFYSAGGQLIAAAEFGAISDGLHYTLAPARNPYYQFQFSTKSGLPGILVFDEVDLINENPNTWYGNGDNMSIFE
jgi:C1A family cysteine protease